MSFSAVVDQRYRLTPADLGGRSRSAMITRVSYQGVETLQPLLHFENMAKPLALNAEQRYAVSQIARSNVIADWAGVMLELVPALDEAGRDVIDIYPIGERRSSRSVRTSERSAYVRPQYADPQPVALPIPVIPSVSPPLSPPHHASVSQVSSSPSPAPVTEPAQIVATTPTSEPSEETGWLAGDLPGAPLWLPILLGLLFLLTLAAVFWLEFT